MHRGKNDRTDGAHRAGFGGRGHPQEYRTEDEKDQDDRGDHSPQHPRPQRPALLSTRLRRQWWHLVRTEDRDHGDVADEQRHLYDRRPDRALVHVADRLAELIGEHHQYQRRRDELGDRPRGRNDAGGELHVIAVAHHDRERDHPHRDHRSGDRAGNRAQHGADDDNRKRQSTGQWTEQLSGAFEQILGETAALEDRAHEREEWNGQQQIVRQDAENPQRQIRHVLRWEEAEIDGKRAEHEPQRGEGECDRKPDQHHEYERSEHQRRHHAERNHCSGFS